MGKKIEYGIAPKKSPEGTTGGRVQPRAVFIL